MHAQVNAPSKSTGGREAKKIGHVSSYRRHLHTRGRYKLWLVPVVEGTR